MDHQQSDGIVHDIDLTRAALDEKLDLLDTRLRQTFDPRYRLARRPWKSLGGAIAAGFALGRRRGQRKPKYLDRTAASRSKARRSASGGLRLMLVMCIAFLVYRVLRPNIARRIKLLEERLRLSGHELTTATDAAWSTGAGVQALGFDSPPIESSYLSNPEVAGVEHAQPYYPPGGAPDGTLRRPNNES